MVYKVSKGGVRSGNTLRGLRSYRTRRYTRQACIVGRSNLKPIDVPTFLDSHIEDKQMSSSLGSTDVALSLNKKKRWLLPATVGHMIKTGSFNDEKTMVSLLERHKLKRRANCVSFVCNQGRIRHVTPKQKRYFDFNVDNIDKVLSNREIKRRYAKARMFAKPKPKKIKITRDSKNRPVKTIEVFTVMEAEKGPNVKKSFMDSKPEYRLEVFYPCPRTCSLTYNPKFTNAHMEFGEEGEIELKSEKKVLKKGRRHRQRFTLKDLETYDPEIDVSDSEDFWDDNFDKEVVFDVQNRGRSLENSLFCQSANKDLANDLSQVQGNQNIFASLIIQAEKAKLLCNNSNPRRVRKPVRKDRHDENHVMSHKGSHIVYTSASNPNGLPDEKHRATLPASTTTNYVTLKSAIIKLKPVDTSPENLRAKFGRFYAEAESEPRRFVIDVTEDVQNLVCLYRDAELSATYTSFLVFVHDGVYDEGLDTFKVIFNSNCCPEVEAFKTCIPFEIQSIDDVLEQVASTVLSVKNANALDCSFGQFWGHLSAPRINCINDIVKASVGTFLACDEIRRIFQTNIAQEDGDASMSAGRPFRSMDLDIFCDICYENINPTQTWDVCGTKMSKCSHIFCDDCWRSHLRTKLMDGAVKMTCPGYDCDETVGPVTMLSLLHVSEVSKFFQRKCEDEADSSSNSRWCPNRSCGRVITLDVEKPTSDMSLDVTCSCGEEFCFSCLSHPHWPATCEQSERYDEKLQTLGSMTNLEEDPTLGEMPTTPPPTIARNKPEIVEIEGRLCPKCSKFIQKYGGCRFIYCRCGHNFCWTCLKDYKGHQSGFCTADPSVLYESTLKLRVNHLAAPTIFTPSPETTHVPNNNAPRQKATLYKKAVLERLESKNFKHRQQRKQLVQQIGAACQKDPRLKAEILSICGIEIDDKETDNLNQVPLAPHVSRFLRSCCEIKRALHHVAEFTFVLLQDTADSVDKRRALRLANDLSSYCSFIRSILEAGQRRDIVTAVKRLADIQVWAKRALTVLLATVNNLKDLSFFS